MCRFLIYKGIHEMLLARIILEPAHSILIQSFDSRLRMDPRRPHNGDGFGVGYYTDPKLGRDPCIYTSIIPAWNCINLERLAKKTMSPLIFAHVRATTEGNLSDQNCHPFQHGRLMFMQNGDIGAFPSLKRDLGASIGEKWYLGVQGSTDSEWAFALFLDHLEKLGFDPSSDPGPAGFGSMVLCKALLAAIESINKLSASLAKRTNTAEAISLLNFAVTDGQSIICTRYVNSKFHEPPTLFYSSGNQWKEPLGLQHKGEYRMDRREKNSDIILVASEPLTFERDNWVKVPANSVLIIDDQTVSMMPILDEFYDPNPLHTRSSKLAREMGQITAESPTTHITPGEVTPNSENMRPGPGPVAARLATKLQGLRNGHSPLRYAEVGSQNSQITRHL